MSSGLGRPKYDNTFIDVQVPHILKAPYQSVIVPRSEKIIPEDIINEVQESGEYMSDSFNTIPTARNIAASTNYGHGPMANSGIKQFKRGKPKGYMGEEPFFHPEGGWQYTFPDAKLPEDYYAENRRPVRYVEIPETLDHWEDPLVMFPSTGKFMLTERDIVPIVPTAVYEVGKPEVGQSSRPLAHRGMVSVSGFTSEFETELPNPIRPTKYIQNRNILSILPPVFTTYIKTAEKKIPIRFKDPHYAAIQASDSEAIDVPLPNGNTIRLKDYQWTVVQNVDSEVELIIELPVNLKDRPDMSFSASQIDSAFDGYIEKKEGRVTDARISTTQTAPTIDQVRNEYITVAPVPELYPSRTYYPVDNALEAFPNNLLPTRSFMKDNPRIVVQPEVVGTAPWLF